MSDNHNYNAPTDQNTREEWRDIPGYVGLYQVSNFGSVRRSKDMSNGIYPAFGKLVSGLDKDGYPIAYLYEPDTKKQRTIRIHRLVAAAFLGPAMDDYEVNHKNGVKTDNHVSNLEYMTRYENIRHSVEVLRRPGPQGVKQWQAKLSDELVLDIRRRHAAGVDMRVLANDYGVCRENIRAIVLRKTWKHVGGAE